MPLVKGLCLKEAFKYMGAKLETAPQVRTPPCVLQAEFKEKS